MQLAAPLLVTALTPAACGVRLWNTGGALRVTVIVKATFQLVHEDAAKLVSPVELVLEDRYRTLDPASSLTEASEVAPYLPGAGLILSGHAYAPAGRAASAMSVRLAMARDRPLLEKTIHVFGDRPPRGSSAAPLPFERMPLVYERAHGAYYWLIVRVVLEDQFP